MASIQKLPSGKWRCQVRKDGIYRARTFDRKSDANTWATSIEAAIAGGASTGTIRPPADLTLERLLKGYMADVKTGRTVHANLNRIATAIGATPVGKLNAIHVQGYVDQRRKQGVTGATIAHDLSCLSAALKWGRRVRHIDINEHLAREARASLSAARIRTRSRERDRIPTEAELQAIFNTIAKRRLTLPLDTLIRFALASAMRAGEIITIRIEDIDWNRKAVLVRARKHPTEKDSNDQLVPLVGESYDLIRKACEGRTEGRVWPFRVNSVSTAFIRICRLAGVEGLTFHDLRHAAITSLFRQGLSIQHVAIVSGHQSWANLCRYTQLGSDDVHDRLNQLARAS